VGKRINVGASLLPSSRNTLRMHLYFFDLLCALVSPWIATALGDPLLLTADHIDGAVAYAVTGFVATLAVVGFSNIGHVIPEYFCRRDLVAIVRVASVSIVVTMLIMFGATHLDNIPRSLPAIHLVVLLALMVGWRWLKSHLAHGREVRDAASSKQPVEHILLIGANRWAWLYSGMVDAQMLGRQKIVAILDEDPRLCGRSIHGHRVIGDIHDIGAVVDEYAVHGISIRRVVVAGRRGDVSQGSWIHLERACAMREIELDALAERLCLLDEGIGEVAKCAPESALAAELAIIRARPYWRVKRAFELAFACLLLILLAPLFLLTFIIVAVDVGHPTIFWQQRVGRDRKPILVYKFRTFRPLFQRDGTPFPEASRITDIGRSLRETRLDELPQLFNVLRGDMSIIGPRPLLPVDLAQSAELRLSVLPGLTGWAQVHGGNLITASEKNALDEWYVRNASIWLDIKIFAKTLLTILRGDRRAEGVLSRAMNASDGQCAGIYALSDSIAVDESMKSRVIGHVELGS
jgi:lipopolysaccharide/colanic/teichoic acid biosynthesis glycosyltransferase